VRLFIAIELDGTAREAIAAEQKRIASSMRDARGSLKWVRPEQMHLTIVFIGEVDEARAASIVEVVCRPVAAVPFDLVFQGAGVFPPHGAPRVLWIGVSRGLAELTDLQREMASRVANCGMELESRPFHPHLTLGRWRESRPSDRRKALEAANENVVAHVHVAAATLFHSKLSSAGSTHTPLTRATLSA
jgi:RNA 2',3'-cyclic 3'-phosphodiesterase